MRQIGPYEVVSEIGSGNMGIVFRAFDLVIHRDVAIKVVKLPDHAGPTDREAYRQRMLREIRSAGRLSHPGIVIVYYSGEDQGLPYIVMEFLEGQTIEQLLPPGPLDKTTVLSLIKQISAALDYAHAKGVVHRDIKPANIMVRGDGTVKIMDFGIAKAAEAITLTGTGLIVGTPAYMSPEQLQSRPLDGRSDQFSLAVMAYEMAAAHRPFVADNVFQLFQKILNEPAPLPNTINPALPASLDQVFTKALAKQPQERYASCNEFATALETAWLQVSRGETPITVPSPRIRTNAEDGLVYVWVPPGKFTMGCSPGDNECFDNEKPPHEAEITRGFWIGQTPVTQAAYEKVMKTNPSHFKGADRPMEKVSWNEANAYCEAAGLRLPTETEWEYAARAGTTGPRYGALDAVAWYGGNSGGTTHPVGLKQPNAFGLYDMLGNVWEWTADNYDPIRKVVRGGSWCNVTWLVRASCRYRIVPDYRNDNIGFRCVGEFR